MEMVIDKVVVQIHSVANLAQIITDRILQKPFHEAAKTQYGLANEKGTKHRTHKAIHDVVSDVMDFDEGFRPNYHQYPRRQPHQNPDRIDENLVKKLRASQLQPGHQPAQTERIQAHGHRYVVDHPFVTRQVKIQPEGHAQRNHRYETFYQPLAWHQENQERKEDIKLLFHRQRPEVVDYPHPMLIDRDIDVGCVE